MSARELFCPACGLPMQLRHHTRSPERFYGCTGYARKGCPGIVPAYPDGGVRAIHPRLPKVEAQMVAWKREASERLDLRRRAGRLSADDHLYFDLVLADADNLVELGEAQAIVRKGTV